jgi:AhpD family alkylhydroperoxidase
MQARIEYESFHQLLPAAGQAMRALTAASRDAGLDPALVELVKIRASQINGCAFCLAMHFADARRQGESQARLDLIAAWREAPLYSERERAALAWTEAVTLITDGHAPDATYDWVRQQFSEKELAALTWAIVTINGWNRVAIAMRFLPKVSAPATAA